MSEQSRTKPLSTWEQDSSFLPEDYVRSKGERRANLLSLSLFGVMMFAVVAAFFATNKRWMNVRSEKQSINAMYVQEAGKIDELKELEKQRDQLIKKAEVTAALVERVPRSLLFAQIVRRMPDDVKLLEMELESEEIKRAAPARASTRSAGVRTLSGSGGKTAAGGKKDDKKEDEGPLVPEYRQSLTLVGVGLSNDDIADYIEALRDCAILSDVELQFIKEVKLEGVELRQFELSAQVRSDVDARGVVDPEDPNELPEVLDPSDLMPSAPVFVPPSQFDEFGNPKRAGGRSNEPRGAAALFGMAFDAIKSFSGEEPKPEPTPQPAEPDAPSDETAAEAAMAQDQDPAPAEPEPAPEADLDASEVDAGPAAEPTPTEDETETDDDASDDGAQEGEG